MYNEFPYMDGRISIDIEATYVYITPCANACDLSITSRSLKDR